MPAQKRDARKNYIDLVDEGTQRIVPNEGPVHPLKDYLRELVANMLKVRHGAR